MTWCLCFNWNWGALTLATDAEQSILTYRKETTWYQGGLIETLNTFFLMIVILCFTQRKEIPKCAFGGAIGLTLCVLICGSGPLTGCAANPFRAIGPNVLGAEWFPLVVYETFPFLGSLIACVMFRYLIDYDMVNDEAKGELIASSDVQAEFN